jgi:hypothetical protein
MLSMIHTTMTFPLQHCILVCFLSLIGSGDTDDLGSLTGRGSGGAGLSAGSTRGLGRNIGGSNMAGGGGGGSGANSEYCGGGMGTVLWCTGHGSPSHVESVDCTERNVPSAGWVPGITSAWLKHYIVIWSGSEIRNELDYRSMQFARVIV